MDIGEEGLDVACGVEGVLHLVVLEFSLEPEVGLGKELVPDEFQLGGHLRVLVESYDATQGDRILHTALILQVILFERGSVETQGIAAGHLSVHGNVLKRAANNCPIAKPLHYCILTCLDVVGDSLDRVLCLVRQVRGGDIPIGTSHELRLYLKDQILYLFGEDGVQLSVTSHKSYEGELHFLLLLQIPMMVLSCYLVKRRFGLAHPHHHHLLAYGLGFWRQIEFVLDQKVRRNSSSYLEPKTIDLVHPGNSHRYVLKSVEEHVVGRYRELAPLLREPGLQFVFIILERVCLCLLLTTDDVVEPKQILYSWHL